MATSDDDATRGIGEAPRREGEPAAVPPGERIPMDVGGDAPTIGGEERPGVGPLLPGQLGQYRIVRLLGEGGMGAVYEAEQAKPRRTVALKVIRPGFMTAGLLRRFEHESHVLGRLQHPGIAQVYEAGTVKDDRGRDVPYFAMELIRGEPLTAFAGKSGLGTRGRLELAAKICDAVYHAHQKGVIHRDLKPGNILVDESGQPKVMDFGVARATDSDIAQTTMQTDIGQLIGTVPYMSPEQVSGDPGELDTRSDVYALGVIMYELLAGRLPYDLSRRMIHEAVRVIREEEPTRLSSVDRRLRGDVETIVGKALEKDKGRRYQSADALAGDIRRYLRQEPITARPASTWYQTRKFAGRNKALVGGVIATFVALLAGVIATSVQAGVASRERDDARRATDLAEERRRVAEAVTKFQERMLSAIDPNEMLGRDPTVRQVLDRAEKSIDTEYAQYPLVRARLHDTLGGAYNELQVLDKARLHATEALRLRRQELGDEDLDTASSFNSLGNVLDSLGDTAGALENYTKAHDIMSRLRGAESKMALSAECNIASAMAALGKFDEAAAIYRRNYEARRRTFEPSDGEIFYPLANLVSVAISQGNFEDAAKLAEEAFVESRRRLGADHPSVLRFENNMAGALIEVGRLDEGLTHARHAAERFEATVGPDFPSRSMAVNNWALALHRMGKPAEAAPLYKQVADKDRARTAMTGLDADAITSVGNYASALSDMQRYDESIPIYREIIAACGSLPDAERWRQAILELNLGSDLAKSGGIMEAEALLLKAHQRLADAFGEQHPYTGLAAKALAEYYQLAGDAAKAATWQAKASTSGG